MAGPRRPARPGDPAVHVPRLLLCHVHTRTPQRGRRWLLQREALQEPLPEPGQQCLPGRLLSCTGVKQTQDEKNTLHHDSSAETQTFFEDGFPVCSTKQCLCCAVLILTCICWALQLSGSVQTKAFCCQHENEDSEERP